MIAQIAHTRLQLVLSAGSHATARVHYASFAARQLPRSRWRRSRSSNGMTLEQGLELSNVWLEFRTEAAAREVQIQEGSERED
jgi:hypothetical protein